VNSLLFTQITFDELLKVIRESVKGEIEQFANGMAANQKEELISIDEASVLLHVSKVTIHKWKKGRLIQSYRIGRRIYFKKNELLDSMKSTALRKPR
jgi:excisionase family DNA binding protein